MKRIWKPLLFFVFCLSIFLLINLPVTTVLGQITLPNNIQINGVKGKISSGRVDSVFINKTAIRDINYSAHFSCLLTLDICYQIDYSNGTGIISFNPISNEVTIKQLDVDYTLAELSPLLPQLPIKPSGELNVQMSQLRIKQNKLNDIKGMITWHNAGIENDDMNLGSYQVSIGRTKKGYEMELIDKENAILDIEGKGLLNPSGLYIFDMDITTQSGLDSSIKNMLELFTRKKGLNEYSISQQLQAPPLLINHVEFPGTD